MNKKYLLVAGLFTFIFLGNNGLNVFCQSKAGKCSGSILALNMAPIKIAEKSSSKKAPCSTTKKRVNESPQKTNAGSSGYYNNVAIDQLGETFINSYPGLTTVPAPKASPPNSIEAKKQLTACRNSLEKKTCSSKDPKIAPKKLRPSATVKLASYTSEH